MGLTNGVEGWRVFMLSSIEITTLQERICRPLENEVQRPMRAPGGVALRKWRNAHRLVWLTVIIIMSFLQQMKICLTKNVKSVDENRHAIAVQHGRRVFASF